MAVRPRGTGETKKLVEKVWKIRKFFFIFAHNNIFRAQ